jgi:glycosyltransferase involved in cell wall biosynthesis
MIAIKQGWDEAARADAPLRVTMLGTRGFPGVQGGAENHAQNLSAMLVELGCDVEVIVRSAYVPKRGPATFKGARLVRLWSPRIRGIEALVHTSLGVLRSAWTRPDILHIHSVGPALLTPLARAFVLRVVVTHHSANYEHDKWGRAARLVLRLGERAGMMFANGRIAVSAALAKRMEHAYAAPVALIPNGVSPPRRLQSTHTLDAFGLTPGRYALSVARIDEPKRQLDLIEAFASIPTPTWKLALVGGADHSSAYTRRVVKAASETKGVILPGVQTGDALSELYTHAGVFVLVSSHEGQPIAVLEAMSYGCPLILSDIAAHREIAATARLVPVGDIAALAERLNAAFADAAEWCLDIVAQERFMKRHDWREIARQTICVYHDALPLWKLYRRAPPRS